MASNILCDENKFLSDLKANTSFTMTRFVFDTNLIEQSRLKLFHSGVCNSSGKIFDLWNSSAKIKFKTDFKFLVERKIFYLDFLSQMTVNKTISTKLCYLIIFFAVILRHPNTARQNLLTAPSYWRRQQRLKASQRISVIYVINKKPKNIFMRKIKLIQFKYSLIKKWFFVKNLCQELRESW